MPPRQLQAEASISDCWAWMIHKYNRTVGSSYSGETMIAMSYTIQIMTRKLLDNEAHGLVRSNSSHDTSVHNQHQGRMKNRDDKARNGR